VRLISRSERCVENRSVFDGFVYSARARPAVIITAETPNKYMKRINAEYIRNQKYGKQQIEHRFFIIIHVLNYHYDTNIY
jgi:hypothetical protein